MCLCVCVCQTHHVCASVSVCARVSCVSMYLHVNVCMHACPHVHVCAYVYVCMHVCTTACMHVCKYVCICVYICVCLRVYACITDISPYAYIQYVYACTTPHIWLTHSCMNACVASNDCGPSSLASAPPLSCCHQPTSHPRSPFGRSKLRPDWLAQRKPKLEHTGARTPKDPRSRRSTDNKANLISPSRLYLGLCCCYMFVYIYTVYTDSTVFVLLDPVCGQQTPFLILS